ncbi:MAG: DUF3299 domain-containing protein [Tateyamaria sp.]|uniref:DUF3299 domain-containing protein n=1 Tax=Tateyamaria sp. TaxID=1929288 RepID=UPI00329048B8
MSIVSSAIRIVAALAISTTLASATENQPVNWGDLIDQSALTFEDPFKDLSYEQIFDVRTVFQSRAELENSSITNDARAGTERALNEALARLDEADLDADWLISQRWIVAERREKAATAANPELDGKTVTLAGFAIPAPQEDDGTRIVYLVPERGMCSHMPPPNANQMVRAVVHGDWSPKTLHEPVRLTGKLSIEETQQSFHIVDGSVQMNASYVLDVTQVETTEDMRKSQQANDWATSHAERLRATGKLYGPKQGVSE